MIPSIQGSSLSTSCWNTHEFHVDLNWKETVVCCSCNLVDTRSVCFLSIYRPLLYTLLWTWESGKVAHNYTSLLVGRNGQRSQSWWVSGWAILDLFCGYILFLFVLFVFYNVSHYLFLVPLLFPFPFLPFRIFEFLSSTVAIGATSRCLEPRKKGGQDSKLTVPIYSGYRPTNKNRKRRERKAENIQGRGPGREECKRLGLTFLIFYEPASCSRCNQARKEAQLGARSELLLLPGARYQGRLLLLFFDMLKRNLILLDGFCSFVTTHTYVHPFTQMHLRL